jgi:hypothetical protein
LAAAFIAKSQKQEIQKLDPQGSVAYDLVLSGPINKTEDLSLKGEINASNVRLRTTISSQAWPVSQGQMRLKVDLPKNLKLETLQFSLGGARFDLSGDISPSGFDLKYQTSGLLTEYKRLFPDPFEFFEVSGPVRVSGSARANLRPQPNLLQSHDVRRVFLVADEILKRHPSMLSGLSELDKALEWDFKAALEAKGCEFTMIYMPTRITEIKGNFQVDKRGLKTSGPVEAMWGKSRGLTEGVVSFTPDGVYKIVFSSFLPDGEVDEWIQKWGPKKRDPRVYKNKVLPNYRRGEAGHVPLLGEIDGTIRAPKARFEKMRLENLQAHFIYRDCKERQGYLEFDQLEADLYGGHAKLNPYMYILGPLFRWGMDVTADNVRIEDLLGDTYGKKSTISGLFSGNITVEGVKDNWDQTPVLVGTGSFALKDSAFLSNPIFTSLGKLTSSRRLENISFTDMRGEFTMKDDLLTFPRIAFKGPIMQLAATGTATTDGALDMIITYSFLNIDVPIINLIPRTIELLTSAFIKARLRGTVDSPEVSIVPLSTDLIPGL